LAGLAIGWVAQAATHEGPPTPASGWRGRVWSAVRGYPALGIAFALLPDLDILLGAHRTVSHSVGGTLLVGAAAWGVARLLRRPPAVLALVCAAAVGSHTLLDWLGFDDAAPYGLTALWPFSDAFMLSGIDLFPPVSRRYWIAEQFLLGNLRAALWELLILGPLAAAAFLWRQRSNRQPGRTGGGTGDHDNRSPFPDPRSLP
jgi:membrane-bound metal-dependent hydrolase YbcI (DUF457 family)